KFPKAEVSQSGYQSKPVAAKEVAPANSEAGKVEVQEEAVGKVMLLVCIVEVRRYAEGTD
ncbi:hypothetical protein HK097_004988, partial [Rhizophlyctis rosea]